MTTLSGGYEINQIGCLLLIISPFVLLNRYDRERPLLAHGRRIEEVDVEGF